MFSFALTLSAADLTGKWTGAYDVVVSDGEPMKGRVLMVLSQSGADLTGTVGPDEDQQAKILKGHIDGDKITFESQTEGPLMKFELRIVQDHIVGEAKGDMDGNQIKAKLDLARKTD
jgi:hypothetical protein